MILVPCESCTYELFKGKEKVVKELFFHSSSKQREIFFKQIKRNELINVFAWVFEASCLKIEGNLFCYEDMFRHKKMMLELCGDCFKTNELAQPLVELLLRFTPFWCVFDENLDVTWLKYCKSVEKEIK